MSQQLSNRSAIRALIVLAVLAGASGWLIATAPKAPTDKEDIAPEIATGLEIRPASGPAQTHMVAAANPLAAEAGLKILRQGGNAVDAAIAVQMVLNLVEPQSSGIGGGGFMLYYDAAMKRVDAFDGRETAPAAATEDMFLREDGEPKAFYDAVVGGLSVGAPGLLRMLEMAHSQHGDLEWEDLFTPAIELAEGGFEISARLQKLVATDKYLETYPTARAYFYGADGRPRPEGEVLVNEDLADTFRRIARRGANAFYTGSIARDIVRTVTGANGNPGRLTEEDLINYEARKRNALCRPYRAWVVCGMPPPSSGGIAVLQILGALERFDLSDLEPNAPESIHLIAEAGGLAFADRNHYVADDDYANVPVDGMLDRVYLAERSNLIDPRRAADGDFAPGEPSFETPAPAGLPVQEGKSTTHVSVVDRHGNAVSMTTSIEGAFGSRLMVRGFLLNNQLTDFAFVPLKDDEPVANRVEPGKRPRSSMAPTLVFDGDPEEDGKLVMAIGSPGGSRIIGYVAQRLVAVLDWGLGLQEAVDMAHFLDRNGPVELEAGTGIAARATALEAMGHEVKVRDLNSGLHGVMVTAEGLVGGADPRREGVVLGD